MIAFIVISILVAAAIGGLTNHLAIKMLFHPRQPVMVRGKRMPFTPGLIPKRREDIADALGDVVAQYLVTAEGLSRLLDEASFQEKVEGKVRQEMQRWKDSDLSIRDFALQWLTEKQWEDMRHMLLLAATSGSSAVLDRLERWTMQDDRPLKEILPAAWLSKQEEVVNRGAEKLADALREELQSARGELLLKQMLSKFMEQSSGGLLGALAGMFMDADRLADKLRPMLIEKLHAPDVQFALRGFLKRQSDRLLNQTVAELAAKVKEADESLFSSLKEEIHRHISEGKWLHELENGQAAKVAVWVEAHMLPKLPELLGWSVRQLQQRMARLVQLLNLPRLVSQEVRKFPIEQLEDVILRLSGKEFRAITWLGALLGGMIGLVQAGLYVLIGI
ncbi:DUF445 family protein [Marinicrinis sediminis]|uniref:DUF445 family protein n=1 Tax=Marinicrinis sediminis TaxID=1652465 RepID=A0ABW5R8U6_9BACL